MKGRNKSYQQTIQRMQQSIRKLDYELERSRMLTHDITIDNKTDRNLDLIIKVQEEFDPLEVTKSQSRVSIPQRTTYRHRISTSREKSNERIQNPNNSNKVFQKRSPHLIPDFQNLDKNNYRSGTIGQQQIQERQQQSSVRLQRKFQPLSRIQAKNDQSFKESLKKQQLVQSGVQTQLQVSSPYSNLSQVKQQWQPVQPIVQENMQTAFLKTPDIKTQVQKPNLQNTIQSTVKRVQQEKNQYISLPVSLFENKMNNIFDRIQNKQEVNQQLHSNQQPQRDQVGQQESFNISFNKFETSAKIHIQSKQNKQWKVEPLGLGYQNNKKYFEISKQQQSYRLAKSKQRQNKFGLNTSRNTRHQSKDRTSTSRQKEKNVFSKIQINKTKVQKPTANDLFLQRKALLMQNLQKDTKRQKELYHIKQEARSPAKTSYISQFTIQNISTLEKRKHQISSKALQVSERLYSRSKDKLKPCDHYQRFSESVERERFNQIVNQNSFVSRKMSKQQREFVFQSLRRSEDSVSTWPMKILNYTYSKLQKIKFYSKSKVKTSA